MYSNNISQYFTNGRVSYDNSIPQSVKKVKTKIIYEESIQEDDDILESVTPKDIKLSKH